MQNSLSFILFCKFYLVPIKQFGNYFVSDFAMRTLNFVTKVFDD